MTYVVRGLDAARFQGLFHRSDEDLAKRGVVRMAVSSNPGFPCRVSLTECDIGETVLLLNHVSHDVGNPYRASHAIFVGEGARKSARYVNDVPPVFQERTLSLRGFDAEGMMVDAVLADPGDSDRRIRDLFANDRIAMIHAHNAVRGCFAATIERN